MKTSNALKILNLKKNYTIKELKKSYHFNALKYHPDKTKNKSEEKFHEIKTAYDKLYKNLEKNTLYENNNTNNTDVNNYNTLLSSIINTIHRHTNIEKQYINNFLNIVTTKCKIVSEKVTDTTIDSLSYDSLLEFYTFIQYYKDVINLPNNIIAVIEKKIREKIQNNEVIILNPSLSDLLNHNIFQLNYENETYNVPLWHSKLNFYSEKQDRNITIICIPELPDHMYIDEKNNIHLDLRFNVSKLLEKKIITFQLENRDFSINIEKLRLLKHQDYIIPESGFARINMKDMLNIDDISHVICHIELD